MRKPMQKLKQKTHDFLKWSEKYTKTDMVYFASGNFWLLLGQIIPIVIGITLTVAFANLLPKETFGTYKYILSIAGFLGAFSLTGMWSAVLRDVARGNDGVMKSAFRISFKWSIMASILATILAGYYIFNGNFVLGISSLLIALSFPILNGSSLYPAFLNGKKDFKLVSGTRILASVVSVGSILLTLLLTKNILIIISTYFIINTVVSFSLYLYTLKKYKPAEYDLPKESLVYAKHLSVMGILSRVAEHLDKILLWHFTGPVQLAIYTFATRPVIELQNLIGNVFPLALPKFASKDLEEVQKTLPLRMFQSLAMIIPIVFLYIIAAPFLFKFVFPQYLDAVFYSQIFVLILLLMPSGFIGTVFVAHAKVKEQYIINVAGSISKMLLLLMLLPPFGIMGAILALIGSNLFVTIVLLFFLFKKK